MLSLIQRVAYGGALAFLPSVLVAGTVEVGFKAEVATVVGTPFGLSVPLGTAATGSFSYETETEDTNPAPERGDYPHAGGGGSFVIRFLEIEVRGSATPFVQVENFAVDTFRFNDGPRPAGLQGGTMKVNGQADSTIELSFTMSKGNGDTLFGDVLPDPFPFFCEGPFPVPLTFSLKDGGGLILLRFTRTAALSGPVIDSIARSPDGVSVVLGWRGEVGRAHRIEFSEDLESWEPLGSEVLAGEGENAYEDTLGARYPDGLPAEAHYRVRALD